MAVEEVEDDAEFCHDLLRMEEDLKSIQALIAEDQQLTQDLEKVDR